MNIGEAMAVGAFPVVHHFPGADLLWPPECLFGTVDDAVALIRSGRPGLYRNWISERYGLERQEATVLRLLEELMNDRTDPSRLSGAIDIGQEARLVLGGERPAARPVR